jgi:hypothetical protein
MFFMFLENKNSRSLTTVGAHYLPVSTVQYIWERVQRWNSRTNSWVEVSGHNLESS